MLGLVQPEFTTRKKAAINFGKVSISNQEVFESYILQTPRFFFQVLMINQIFFNDYQVVDNLTYLGVVSDFCSKCETHTQLITTPNCHGHRYEEFVPNPRRTTKRPFWRHHDGDCRGVPSLVLFPRKEIQQSSDVFLFSELYLKRRCFYSKWWDMQRKKV